MLTIVLLLALSGQAVQLPILTDVEQARLTPTWVEHLAHDCAPLRRQIIANREVSRFVCPEGTARVDVFSGAVTIEHREPAKAKLKRWGLAAGSIAIAAIYIYAKARS